MSESNPWKKLSSKVIYKNPWITLREDEVIKPNGEPGIYGVVVPRIATGVVAISENKEIYLVGQYRYPTDVYSWEIPEGGAEEGEDPLDAIKRELKEEAGVTALHWETLGSEIHLSNCFTSERAFLYFATGLIEGKSAPEETEVLAVKKVPFQEALKMVERGEIFDAMTIMGILLASKKI